MNPIWKIVAGASPAMALIIGLLYIWDGSLAQSHTEEMERLRLIGQGIPAETIRCYQNEDHSLCHELLDDTKVQKQTQTLIQEVR